MRHYHGKRHSRAYTIWCGIRARCLNANCKAYPNYGGRGISLCERWGTFPGFYGDMGDPPLGASIDRIDNDLGYEPNNCRWATRTEQNRNKRGLHMLTVAGETLSMGEWAERSGLKISTLWQRINAGWSPEAAITTPLVRDRRGKPHGFRWDGAASQNLRLPGGIGVEQIAAIKAAPKVYGSGRALAREYGVSEALISAIRSGRRFAWVSHDDAEARAA